MSIQLLSFIWLVSTAIGAALGASVNRSGVGAILGLFLGPIGWIIVLLLPREANEPTAKAHQNASMPSPNLSDDAYKIWLGKAYHIAKNDLFEKYECDDKLFETLEEALAHAHQLNSQKLAKERASLATKNSSEPKRDDQIILVSGGIVALLMLAAVMFSALSQ